ncbi:MAG: T9SS C-terminal target domain-containing protein [Chitinophagia bacterium]|nr:T9SS C-terminal target domain-containing protein [Chitinophagia bacterium]
MMRKLLLIVVLFACSLIMYAQEWKPVTARNATSRLEKLFSCAEPFSKVAIVNRSLISLPGIDGNVYHYQLRANGLLPVALTVKYNISSYDIFSLDGKKFVGKLERDNVGLLHACLFHSPSRGLVFIDPIRSTGMYRVHYAENNDPLTRGNCLVQGVGPFGNTLDVAGKGTAAATGVTNGTVLRTYRLALSCNHQYADSVTQLPNPTKADVLSKMVTTLNRVNGVYEQELSISLTLVSNEDTLIFNDATNDPFGTLNNDPAGLLLKNQVICDSLIGTLRYDIGHIFSTGGGGLSQVGNVCKDGFKAQSVTGSLHPYGDNFDIDYVAHEIGHEFGANHCFNNNSDKNCSGNAYPPTAVEPGSGSTIMCYAGICAPDNIQPHSDAYFSAMSLTEIIRYVNSPGSSCGTRLPSGNKVVGAAAFNSYYSIPALTPFELTAPGVKDTAGGNAITYCWEQWNFGDFGQTLLQTSEFGPLFRSYLPDSSPVRVFPRLAMVLNDSLSDAGNDNAQGEKLPDVDRFLTFRLTVRNQLSGRGCLLFADDSIHIDVKNTGSRFKLTTQREAGLVYLGGTTQTVQWDVAGTDRAPINAANVDIYLSDDGGKTWRYNLGTYPNTGSADVVLPNPDATIATARIKVKGSNNIFFHINRSDFSVFSNNDTSGTIRIFPIPAHSSLNIVTGQTEMVQGVIYNTAGREAWKGNISGIISIDVAYWPRGMYFVKLRDSKGSVSVRKVVIY